MADTATRRRRRALLVPLLGAGVAAWAVHRRLGERPNLDQGWHPLPPSGWPLADVLAPAPAAAEPAPEPVPAGAARSVPAAAAVVTVAAPARPDVSGSLSALADGSSPDPGYAVKGKSATKIFHAPGGAYYTRTRADVWFRTADDARAAGFTERARRHR